MITRLSAHPWISNILPTHKINQYMKYARIQKQSLSCYLIQNNLINDNELQKNIVSYTKQPLVENLDDIDHIDEIYINLCLDNNIIIHETNNTTHCYLIEPLNDITKKKLLSKFTHIKFHVSRYNQLIPKLYDLATTNIAATLENSTYHNNEMIPLYLKCMLLQASWLNVSDIHMESQENNYHIRFRQDGILRSWSIIRNEYADQLCNQIKLMASMNIAEKRLPQDGRIKFHHPCYGERDIRISSCPTIHSEKIVLRILQSHHQCKQLSELGLSKKQTHDFKKILEKRQGLILVSGPTGSGKTITLYSALHYLNNGQSNICTAENPVEIDIPGINQVQIHYAIQLDFPNILRTFLRQDPDIMMIGEIRDQETAQIALHASQTGHLVLATLHSNHAIGCIDRLKLMNIPTYELIANIQCIIAQRLIRKLCSHCKKPERISATYHQYLKKIHLTIDEDHLIYQATGCHRCHNGYQGRIAIFDILYLDNPSYKQQLLENKSNINPLKHFYHAAIHCIKNSITSVDEALRILRSL